MKADEAIRKAYENEISEVDLSDKTYDKMLRSIEKQKEVSKKVASSSRLAMFFSKLQIANYVGVLAFICILIFIPYGVSHYSLNRKQLNNNSIVDKSGNGAFVSEIEKLIEERHAYSGISKTPQETESRLYTNINDIKEKAPFSIEYPKFLPEGYVIENTELSFIRFDFDNGASVETPSLKIRYVDKNGNRLTVTEDKSECSYGINESFYINLDGIDAWLLGNSISFWTKDRMYDITTSTPIDKDTMIKVAKSFDVFSDHSLWLTDKYETYDDLNEIKNKVPFTIEFPKFCPKDCSQGSTFLDITKNPTGAFYDINTYYMKSNKRCFSIHIMSEASKPEDILKKCEKVTLGSLEVWIYPTDTNKGNNQVMFWKNGLYYNIASAELDVDTLKNIAESYNN